MHSPGDSRIGRARARAGMAKTVVAAGSLGALAVFGLLARASHASYQSAGGSSGGALTTPENMLAALQRSQTSFDDDDGGGEIESPDRTPQVHSSTS